MKAAYFIVCFFVAALLFIPTAETFSNSYNVTLELTFNMSGENYTAFADNYTDSGTYDNSNISQYYACINTSQNYTTGLAFTGTNFVSEDIANQTNIYSLRMTQAMAGNEFIIPVFPGNCNIMDDKISSFPGYMNGPFVKFLADGAYMAVLSLSYPGVDFYSPLGDEFSKETSLLLKRNETGNITQIIMEKR